jgi:hypothetical protein
MGMNAIAKKLKVGNSQVLRVSGNGGVIAEL